jgi:hypothetical protein
VQVRGRKHTIWITDPDDGISLSLSTRRDHLRELIRRGEETGIDPEELAADREILRALDEYIALHGDPWAGEVRTEQPPVDKGKVDSFTGPPGGGVE